MSRAMTTGQTIWIRPPSVRALLPTMLDHIVDCIRNTDFRGKFNAIQRTYSPVPRKFYGYCTSITVRSVLDHLAGYYSLIEAIVGNCYNGWHPCKWYVFRSHLTTGHVTDRLAFSPRHCFTTKLTFGETRLMPPDHTIRGTVLCTRVFSSAPNAQRARTL